MTLKKNNLDFLTEAALELKLSVKKVSMRVRKKNRNMLLISSPKKCFLASSLSPGFYPTVARWSGFMTGSKSLTQLVLEDKGYSVIPSHHLRPEDYSSFSAFNGALSKIKHNFPILIKPDSGFLGRGISIVENKTQLTKLIKKLYTARKRFMLQPILDENEYRILVVNNEVLAVHSKHNPIVIGDNKQTIKKLLGSVEDVKKNDVFINWQYKKTKTKPTTVLKKGEVFAYHLTKIPTAIYYKTEDLPKRLVSWSKKLAHDVGSSVVGIDVFIPGSLSKTHEYVVIELNSNPGIDYFHTHCGDAEMPKIIFKKVLKEYFSV